MAIITYPLSQIDRELQVDNTRHLLFYNLNDNYGRSDYRDYYQFTNLCYDGNIAFKTGLGKINDRGIVIPDTRSPESI